MAAPPSETAHPADLLATVDVSVVTDRAAEAPEGAVVRSHLDDGRLVRWTVPAPLLPSQCAVDAERHTRCPPAFLARRMGFEDDDPAFWAAWTRLEVAAKLDNRPVHLMVLGSHPTRTLHTRTFEVHDVTVTVGTLAPTDPEQCHDALSAACSPFPHHQGGHA